MQNHTIIAPSSPVIIIQLCQFYGRTGTFLVARILGNRALFGPGNATTRAKISYYILYIIYYIIYIIYYIIYIIYYILYIIYCIIYYASLHLSTPGSPRQDTQSARDAVPHGGSSSGRESRRFRVLGFWGSKYPMTLNPKP